MCCARFTNYLFRSVVKYTCGLASRESKSSDIIVRTLMIPGLHIIMITATVGIITTASCLSCKLMFCYVNNDIHYVKRLVISMTS